jgi:hypothetical protein
VRTRLAIASGVLLIVSVIGLVVSDALNEFVFDKFDAYGEVPIPGTRTPHLPAGDVTVSFNASHIADVGLPDDLEMTITPPSGVAEPTVTQDSRRNQTSWRVAHIAQAGDYTITTNGKVADYDSPRLSFGHPSRFEFLDTLFGALTGVMATALGIGVLLWVLKFVRLNLRGPTFTGAPVSGTGQVLSMQETGFQIGGGEKQPPYQNPVPNRAAGSTAGPGALRHDDPPARGHGRRSTQSAARRDRRGGRRFDKPAKRSDRFHSAGQRTEYSPDHHECARHWLRCRRC